MYYNHQWLQTWAQRVNVVMDKSIELIFDGGQFYFFLCYELLINQSDFISFIWNGCFLILQFYGWLNIFNILEQKYQIKSWSLVCICRFPSIKIFSYSQVRKSISTGNNGQLDVKVNFITTCHEWLCLKRFWLVWHDLVS